MTYYFLDNYLLHNILTKTDKEYIMSRTSPYEIILSNEERDALEKIARKYTSPYFEVIRAKAMLLSASGIQNKEIGVRLELPRQIISKWRKRFYEERLDGLKDRPRHGRPRAFSP